MTQSQVIDHDDVAQHPEPARKPRGRAVAASAGRMQLPTAAEPMNMIMLAIDRGASIEVIKQLVELQERVDANTARKAFNLAIAAAKADLPVIVKNRRVKYDAKRSDGKVDYAHEDLAQIAEQIDDVLAKHGLSYRFRTSQPTEARVAVTCIISHELGHSEENTLSAGIDVGAGKNHLQAVGSGVTYLSRYTLKPALGLAAAEHDDDGRAAGSVEPKPQQAQQGPPRASAAQTAGATAAPQKAAERATGPREIIPVKGDTFSTWSLRYIEAFKAANTVEELTAYDKINDVRLTKIFHEARPTYDEINKAYQHHMAALQAKTTQARPDPISTGVAPAPKWTSPDPDKEYEAFLTWAADQLVNWAPAASGDLEEFWNTMIEPFSIFPSDKDDLLSLYRKAEKRLEA